MIKQLRVLGATWEVKKDEHLLHDEDRWGDTNQRTRVVRLDPHSEQPSTLFHELTHIIEWGMGVDETDEQAVQSFAKCWAAVFSDNPELVAWMIKEIDNHLPGYAEKIKKGLA